MTPMPPNCAMAMASAVSVTVSMAAETIGTLRAISRVRRVRISTSPGMTSDGPGSSSTSSNVMAWRMRIEGGCCSIDPSIDSPGAWEVASKRKSCGRRGDAPPLPAGRSADGKFTMPSGVYAAIFDLDGVLTSTSVRHEQSWADAAKAFNIPITDAALRATRSIPRASSLAALLAHAGVPLTEADRDALMAFKNQRYKELIAGLQPTDAFPGARRGPRTLPHPRRPHRRRLRQPQRKRSPRTARSSPARGVHRRPIPRRAQTQRRNLWNGLRRPRRSPRPRRLHRRRRPHDRELARRGALHGWHR